VLAPAGAAQAGSLWTPVASGTTDTIAAIAWPTSSEIVLVTTAGHIQRSTASGFVAATLNTANALGFTDVAMSPDGTKGVAVGPNGAIYRSSDSGSTWTKVIGTQTYAAMSCNSAPGPLGSLVALNDDLQSVKFADANTVYITGTHSDVLRSTNVATAFTFSEVNKKADGTCVTAPGGSGDFFGDTAWINASTGFLLSSSFGTYSVTTDSFATAAQKANALNGFGKRDQLALDTANPNRAWAVNPYGGGGSYFQATTDGGVSWNGLNTNDGNNEQGLRDIAYAGGTVVTAGDGGDIYTSPDGRNFFRQAGGAPNTGVNWRAAAMLDGANAAVGGEGGALLLTTKANQIPDTIPPTGTISGPTKLATGQFASYVAHVTDNVGGSGVDPSGYVWSTAGQPNQTGTTATFGFSTTGSHTITLAFRDLAGNPGSASITVQVSKASTPPPAGSSPVTNTSGGGTVTVFKRVTITGRKRFIPVRVSAKKARKFVITVLTIKGHHHVAVAYATLKKKGSKTVNVQLAKSVKTGKYLLIVRVFDLHGHGLGRDISVAFILA
jgi:photosystem II stability/assembly factor-like uncharacterized protein